MYPGQLHNIRKNAFNLIHVMDLSLVSSLEIITAQISVMIQRNVPIRFGVVPMFEPGTEDICELHLRIKLTDSPSNGSAILLLYQGFWSWSIQSISL